MTIETEQRRALEAYLASAARLGDRAALTQLAKLAGPGLYAHACRLMGETDMARDVVQAAWVEILSGLPRLRDPAAFRAFALRIVTRRVARVIAGRQTDRRLAAQWSSVQPVAHEGGGEAAFDAARLHAALATLSPDHRATLALFYLEDLTVAEVAHALDVPIGTVKTRLMHARAKLRGLLEGE